MEYKTAKQRLDAYVQAAMTGMLSGADVNSTCTYDNIHYAAQRMMDYVDAQQAEAKPEEDADGWILNTGTKPENLSPYIDCVVQDGTQYFNANSRVVRWNLDPTGRHIGDIIKWRKA